MSTGHEKLEVWQKSMDLAVETYRITGAFPKEEMYSLTSQIRRCAISIPSNIAEGSARGSQKEFIRFLYISLGSAAELSTQLNLAQRIGYVKTPDSLLDKLESIQKMLNALISSLKRKTIL